MLVLLGIDREIVLCVDRDIIDGVRHAASALGCTIVVIDDPDGTIHDQFGTATLVGRPVLFVGQLTDRAITRAAAETDGHELLVELAIRLNGGNQSVNGDGADLVVRAAGAAELADGDRLVGLVRVLSGDE
jgi:hypothetical protein